MKTARERAEEKRLEKLELIRTQVASGVLVIRPMTDEERRQYPRVTRTPSKPGTGEVLRSRRLRQRAPRGEGI